MVPDLPWELVVAIIRKVADRNTLLSLCLTAKVVYEEASRCLYCDLTDNFDEDTDRHLSRIKTLIAHPHLSLLVRSFTVDSVASMWRRAPEGPYWGTEGEESDPAADIWDILPQALNLMSNLEYFSFRELYGQPSANWLLPNVSFQLKKMEWGSREEGEPMGAFLTTQSRLESLYLIEGPSCPLEPGACPTLQTLKGDLLTFERFLPGRPSITELDWTSPMHEYDGDPIIETLLPELHRITHFTIRGPSEAEKLGLFGACFRNLVAIEVRHISEVSVIMTMPKLKTLVIPSAFEYGEPLDPTSFIQRLFEGASSLHNIFTSLKEVSLTKKTWKRSCSWWARSKMSTPTPVLFYENVWPNIHDYCSPEQGLPPGWTIEEEEADPHG